MWALKDLEEYGTYLAIVEPEFMDCTTPEEQYPFVLIADGDWGVTTAVAPPEGFIADYPELSTTVSDAVTALQFTLTDVGSDWSNRHHPRHHAQGRDPRADVAGADVQQAACAGREGRQGAEGSAGRRAAQGSDAAGVAVTCHRARLETTKILPRARLISASHGFACPHETAR